MKKLRMGIIGAGMAFERLHYPAYRKLTDKFEIVAIADKNTDRLKQWKEKLGLNERDIYRDFRDMITRPDLDAFDIMVPIEINYETTEAVAEAGKPIICEKPLGATREQIEAARNLVDRYEIPIMIAENFRYNEENNIIRDLIRTKEIGEVHYFIQNRVINFPEDMLKNKFAATEWRQHPEYPGGTFMDTAIHDIAALRHIFGAIDRVQAIARKEKRDFFPYSVIQANMIFKNGVTGNFTFFTAGKEMQRPLIGLRIFGSKGMIYLEERNCGTINIAYNDGNSKQIPYKPEQGFYNELLNFYKAVTGQEPLSVTPEMEFGDALTIFSILESIKTEKVTGVDEIKEYEPIY
ncbi:Gfo/Idh/MocA family protein [Halothermothrix orenii]|uniref:Oxidoreductase domain protein n=1 Tax=Halothermothrix orenii (strain H 168 / OCM 544 / DSM 9562) TaxID=373903 RepID=B8CX59_HALOH|nr:Gfo/Idh/MocA family oxidoreductase [Halothermothrix orenii]ACL69878.1 oxidoreductase domain protein [Halothermothrix orenii H 168]